MKSKVLFVCMYNVRNPIAQTFLESLAGEEVEIHSAWVDSNRIGPAVENVLKEVGVDFCASKTNAKKYTELSQSEVYNYVITICDEGHFEYCPVFPNAKRRIYWKTPTLFANGSPEPEVNKLRKTRDQIKQRVEALLKEIKNH